MCWHSSHLLYIYILILGCRSITFCYRNLPSIFLSYPRSNRPRIQIMSIFPLCDNTGCPLVIARFFTNRVSRKRRPFFKILKIFLIYSAIIRKVKLKKIWTKNTLAIGRLFRKPCTL